MKNLFFTKRFTIIELWVMGIVGVLVAHDKLLLAIGILVLTAIITLILENR